MRTYKKTKLKNGFTIITCKDTATEIVDIDIVIKAGARYEADKEAGYAHLLEHMLMKGSHAYPTAYDIALFTERAGHIAMRLLRISASSLNCRRFGIGRTICWNFFAMWHCIRCWTVPCWRMRRTW